ncbi:ABC transporter ATP-binding protein [Algoriphagus taiwanensis]|uniref:ABC transporter ATP-binding protein n=1 Tax=Algoriphagus taiwanensis TaxID=1445656 RepID=A0ABQ6Q012_9BACT|nr:ABC transporter ATP-binding protein [Algoriphagus taiwanensis]
MRQRSLASILQGKDLQLGYLKNGKRREVLSHLDFELFTGEMTCLLGPNGVGKSTLVKAIMAQLQPWQGSLNLDGQAISSYSQESLARKMAVVLTEPVFPGNMTVGELVALGRTPYTGWSGRLSLEDQKEVEKAIALTNIVYLKSERLSEISDGQRQKAMIARAIAQNGDLIILDEPTAHLDLVNRFEIMDLLREIALEENKGVLVVTHDLEIAIETADRFWLLTCGNPLLSGSPEDLILSGEINQLLPSKKIQFSPKRGRLEIQDFPEEILISGNEELVYWVRKGLKKAGIQAVPKEIRVQADPFRIIADENTFQSVEELISSLKLS